MSKKIETCPKCRAALVDCIGDLCHLTIELYIRGLDCEYVGADLHLRGVGVLTHNAGHFWFSTSRETISRAHMVDRGDVYVYGHEGEFDAVA